MELLVAVVLTSIIAAAGISSFQYMVLRAQRAEGPIFLEQIRQAELAYHATWGSFTSAGPSPATTPGRALVTFTPTSAWQHLGWAPPSDTHNSNSARVRGKYQVTSGHGTSPATDWFNGSAVLDVDGDSTEASYTCNRAIKSKMRSAASVY